MLLTYSLYVSAVMIPTGHNTFLWKFLVAFLHPIPFIMKHFYFHERYPVILTVSAIYAVT